MHKRLTIEFVSCILSKNFIKFLSKESTKLEKASLFFESKTELMYPPTENWKLKLSFFSFKGTKSITYIVLIFILSSFLSLKPKNNLRKFT